jgi:hypothetical protein
MAEVYSVTAGAVALTAATAKTVIEITTTSTKPARVVQWSATLDASAAAAGVKVELVRYTGASTGSAYTPLKYNGEGQAIAAQTSAKTNDTVEPTTPTVVETYYIPNTAGIFVQYPLGREHYVPISTIWGIRVTSAAVVNVSANLAFEE